MRTTLLALCRTHLVWVALLLLAIPSLCLAEPEQPEPGLPPISQQMVREGDFAVKLCAALGLGTIQDETEAESGLGQAGIIPRNGWIADYPVTPDIIGELQQTVGDAALKGKIALGKDVAQQRLTAVAAELSLGLRPQASVGSEEIQDQPAAQGYPNPTVINNYYQSEGPPRCHLLHAASRLLLFVRLDPLSLLVRWLLVSRLFYPARFSPVFSRAQQSFLRIESF